MPGLEDWLPKDIGLFFGTDRITRFVYDYSCPTWTKLKWWEKLIGRKPKRVAYLIDGIYVVSAQTYEVLNKASQPIRLLDLAIRRGKF